MDDSKVVDIRSWRRDKKKSDPKDETKKTLTPEQQKENLEAARKQNNARAFRAAKIHNKNSIKAMTEADRAERKRQMEIKRAQEELDKILSENRDKGKPDS